MYSSLVTFVATALSLSTLIAASPAVISRTIDDIFASRDVTHIARDDLNARYIAYKRDGSLFGIAPFSKRLGVAPAKRDTSACSDLSTEAVQTIPGWSQITDYATANWGTGSYNLVTNPSDYPDSPAQSCVQQDPASVTLNGTPNCVTSSQKSNGTTANTNTTITLTNMQGFTSTQSNTVTKTSSLAEAVSWSVQISFPDLFDVSAGSTTTGTITNEESSGFDTSINGQQSQSFLASASAGQTCYLTFSTTDCNIDGNGQIKTTATGWVWFDYNSKTEGHYKWAVSLDAVLPNEDDRSDYVQFTSSMQGTSQSNFNATCV